MGRRGGGGSALWVGIVVDGRGLLLLGAALDLDVGVGLVKEILVVWAHRAVSTVGVQGVAAEARRDGPMVTRSHHLHDAFPRVDHALPQQ